jgi:hypothetical protein
MSTLLLDSARSGHVTQEEFEKAYELARQRFAEEDSLYWRGYARGLRGAFLGNDGSAQVSHFAWLDFMMDEDCRDWELGCGYFDGMKAVVSARMPVSNLPVRRFGT